MIKIFRCFKYRNFRLFFPGLAVSQTGVWVQNVAISWLVYDITKSALSMGTIMFFNTIPLFLLTPFTGAIVDKFNRHKLLIIVQALYVIQALSITIVSFLGLLNIPFIMFFGIFLNSIAAIDAPVRQSSYVLLVDDPKDLSNAISLNSSCFNLARFVGSALGGLLVGYIGATSCFFVEFLFLLPSLFLIKAMKINDVKSNLIQNENILKSISQGFLYSAKHPPIITAQVYLFLFSLIAMSYPILLPIYTADVLKENADILGYLIGATGVGSLITSLLLASKMSIKGLRRILFLGCMLISTVFIFVGSNSNHIFALIAMLFLGVGMTCFITPQNVLVQTIVEDFVRGRIISINTLAFLGTTSLSNFICGLVVHNFGISKGFIVLGSTMFVIACIFSYIMSKFNYNKPSQS